MTIDRLFAETDSGPIRCKVIRPIFEVLSVGDAAAEYFHDGAAITSSADVTKRFASLSLETREHFIALHVDSKNRLLCMDRISTGSLNASVVHPREVFKSCLLSSAAALIILHNHPSGDPTPSREDHEITTRLKDASELLGIRLLDHIVIGDNRHYSFADQGLL